MELLLGKTIDELKETVKILGLPTFTAKQISQWLYQSTVNSIDEMTNISLKNREILKSKYEFGVTANSKVTVSSDGTKKYLFPAGKNKYIEAAYIPDRDRHTLCVSSQVGCKMGCLFCATAKQGFQGQLSAGEIINQIRSIPERDQLTNIVYMGMGEPLDNLAEVMKSLEILTSDWGFAMSPRRITVSTIGIIPAMKEFIEKSNCHLAVSLHSPFNSERSKLMPIQSRYTINQIIDTLKAYDFGGQRRISFEYIVFKGLNDSEKHVNELAKILNGINCRINLIRYHSIPGFNYESPKNSAMHDFREALNRKGIIATIRSSRGEDILAACGLLSTTELRRV
ncbi:MAG: 23S rRNA (adenine(2503)-C(2))-methyltransferase RlmN [Bacteroidetes bacterium]|nr:23S rRNA (adenine(2503)-C(2))-methyltransferase RlmN [Bacteroidota bacterium]MBT7039228.1 23S rRNA (adenine(2503)-C(2))-methyltransferase RlmN [Bacteroidota bacterium]MBT7825476.1 23S rRNA (adenine(2503)-C(2))-methyltransferase RlmN [Bacteroidota bacterium]MBT7994992.1 23S rRNA (adenine(2503)-C(2))-methyltransferase RlmN [Bacteroidota bacterium]